MSGTSRLRFGYLLPEFPGQTHAFFWRERSALLRRGLEPQLVSTRRPARRLMTAHTWAAEAVAETSYLAPPAPRRLAEGLRELVRRAPGGMLRCLGSLRRASDVGMAGRLRLAALMVAGAQLAALARERGWPHVHVHSCADAAHVALFAHLLSGLPYSLTLHGPLQDYGPNQREKWSHAAFAVVITQRLLREVRELLGGSLPPVSVAPMGVEPERFARVVPYRAWDGREAARVFSCGRLNPCKGHAELIAAVGLLRGRGVDVRLTIAGEDELGGAGYRKELERAIAAAGLEGSVSLLGAVSEAVVRTQLEQSHVFALASHAEPLGVAIMEAMAMQTPVVVTAAGGVPELVDDGRDGLLVPPRDPGALVGAIARVLGDPALAARLGAAARQKVLTAFGSDLGAETLARRIREAAASPAGTWARR